MYGCGGATDRAGGARCTVVEGRRVGQEGPGVWSWRGDARAGQDRPVLWWWRGARLGRFMVVEGR